MDVADVVSKVREQEHSVIKIVGIMATYTMLLCGKVRNNEEKRRKMSISLTDFLLNIQP
jgi:hypothetical protein